MRADSEETLDVGRALRRTLGRVSRHLSWEIPRTLTFSANDGDDVVGVYLNTPSCPTIALVFTSHAIYVVDRGSAVRRVEYVEIVRWDVADALKRSDMTWTDLILSSGDRVRVHLQGATAVDPRDLFEFLRFLLLLSDERRRVKARGRG